MRVCHGRKIKIVLIKKRLWLITLLILAGLLYAQQARALPSPQENPEINNLILPEKRLVLDNPNAASYLSFNPFTLSEFQPSLSSSSQIFGDEEMTMLFSENEEINIVVIIKRPPVRVPVRPTLRSPYIAL